MAAVSHLPQMAASALMRVVGELAGPEGLELAGPGLFDTTRLAASPSDVWSDICATNANHLGWALDQYITALTSLKSMVTERGGINEVFVPAREWRRRLELTLASSQLPTPSEPDGA